MASNREAVWFLFWLLLILAVCWAIVAVVVWAAIQALLFMGSFIVPTVS